MSDEVYGARAHLLLLEIEGHLSSIDHEVFEFAQDMDNDLRRLFAGELDNTRAPVESLPAERKGEIVADIKPIGFSHLLKKDPSTITPFMEAVIQAAAMRGDSNARRLCLILLAAKRRKLAIERFQDETDNQDGPDKV